MVGVEDKGGGAAVAAAIPDMAGKGVASAFASSGAGMSLTLDALAESGASLSMPLRAALQSIFRSCKEFQGFGTMAEHAPDTGMEQLYVEGFDVEQIWSMLQLENQPITRALRKRVNALSASFAGKSRSICFGEDDQASSGDEDEDGDQEEKEDDDDDDEGRIAVGDYDYSAMLSSSSSAKSQRENERCVLLRKMRQRMTMPEI